jgi:hypothetical protein
MMSRASLASCGGATITHSRLSGANSSHTGQDIADIATLVGLIFRPIGTEHLRRPVTDGIVSLNAQAASIRSDRWDTCDNAAFDAAQADLVVLNGHINPLR